MVVYKGSHGILTVYDVEFLNLRDTPQDCRIFLPVLRVFYSSFSTFLCISVVINRDISCKLLTG